jgi:hypothetical protein
VAGITFLGGLQLLVLGVIGEYIGLIHDEVKRRPLYLVREQLDAWAPLPPDAGGAGRARPADDPAAEPADPAAEPADPRAEEPGAGRSEHAPARP